ncbi:GTPase IMAP family member 4-like [Salarias fasciatus]|uniref:GTPase IMAP family member 4-like n=1 Tax=Salarias fasciatus TaxID=181472 RepID=A0A672IJ16_SALFA|nr:GTPase IMAP family member 4-like [Salarias fasciatus]
MMSSEFLLNLHQFQMEATPLRVVLLGKTGSGKSKFGNALIGEPKFDVDDSANSGTSKCQAATKRNGEITVVDTPGFFDTSMDEAKLKPEIVKSITECSPGPHAFLIFLKVEKYTELEIQVITKIEKLFSDKAFKYAILVFTHGDQLPQGKTIKQFVSENKDLKELSEKCGGRCHVVDNKYWNNNQQDRYRNNQVQITQLLSTINQLVEQNGRECYTNELLQAVERNIREETERTGSREEAKKNVSDTFLKKTAGFDTEDLLAAFVGHPGKVALVVAVFLGVVIVAGPIAGVAVGVAAGAASGVAAGAAAGAAVGSVVGLAAGAGAAGATVRGVVAAARRRPAEYELVETDSVEEVEVYPAETTCESLNTQRKTKAE